MNEIKEKVEPILKKYVKCIGLLNVYERGYMTMSEKRGDTTYNDLIKTKYTVESALSVMKPELRFFIENEYIYNYNRNWWFDYYSKATYYRRKEQSLIEFADSLDLNCSLIYE